MPRKPAVSIRGETYKKLKEEAEKRGMTVTALLEEILEKSLDKQRVIYEAGTPPGPIAREYFDNPTAPPMLTPKDSPAMTRMRKR